MAQPQNNVSLTAPGFAGLNTQDSPLSMDISFASIANNCVIDELGRIGSRRGFQAYTTNPSILNNNPIKVTEEFVDDAGASTIFAAGNLSIYVQNQGTPDFNLVPLTLPVDYVVTADNWRIVPFNEKVYFVQALHAPLVYDPLVSTTSLQEWAELPNGTSYPNEAHAAYGRLWCSDFDNAPTVVFWSGLLDGENWTDLGTGSLNTEEYWPSGYDTVRALAAHNNFMIVFGQNNILLYQTTPDVNNTITLRDTIEGLGVISRDSLQPTGTDYMFIDATGVRSLNRTIQEKSIPVGDISRNVRTEFQRALTFEVDTEIRGMYHVEDNFYVCFLPNNPKSYVFDTWQPLPDGSARCTVWNRIAIRCGVRLESRVTLFGGIGGLYSYRGSFDIGIDDTVPEDPQPVPSVIPFEYWTHPIDFGSPANLIFPKQVDVTLSGGLLGDLRLCWAYDYKYASESNCRTLPIPAQRPSSFWYTFGDDGGDPPVYNPSPEYPGPEGLAEWSDPPNPTPGELGYWTSGEVINQLRYNIWGSGRNVRIGLKSEIAGSTISIQEVNIQVLQGRIL